MSARGAIRDAWALLLGIGFIMLGNGLQGTLLGLRATLEGFSTSTTGLVMTAYFAGFVVGSLMVPRLVERVGHVRVFAALASLASASVLLHAVFVSPWAWAGMRLSTGFCYAGMYVVAESWLNGAATRETRGQVLSAYMLVMLIGMGAGQLLLNLADPRGFELFLLVSVLVSMAVIPLTLSAKQSPIIESPERLSLRELLRISPLGLYGMMLVSIGNAAMFGMGAVYASGIGLDTTAVSYFMAAMIFGAVVLQWPIGYLSDRFDRRRVIVSVAAASALCAALAGFASDTSFVAMTIFTGLMGGTSLPLYSLCIAHTNDYLTPRQILRASSSLMLFGGIGLTSGPVLVAGFMSILGPPGFFWFLTVSHAAIALFAVYRMSVRDAIPLEDQRHYENLHPRATLQAASAAFDSTEEQPEPSLATWSRY